MRSSRVGFLLGYGVCVNLSGQPTAPTNREPHRMLTTLAHHNGRIRQDELSGLLHAMASLRDAPGTRTASGQHLRSKIRLPTSDARTSRTSGTSRSGTLHCPIHHERHHRKGVALPLNRNLAVAVGFVQRKTAASSNMGLPPANGLSSFWS